MRAALWVILLFALVRIGWVQQNVLLPFAGFQGRIACALAGTSPTSVYVGLSCTAADPMALVLGAVLAFPVAWRQRLSGCAIGLMMILALNTARIGTLSLLVDRRELFELLHVYIWPAVLIVFAAGYVFAWMGRSMRQPSRSPESAPPEIPFARLSMFSRRTTLRFLGLMSLFVLVFYLGYRTWMTSAIVLELARWATVAAGVVMKAFGTPAEVTANSLRTPQGTWIVTQSCVVTPLLPVYLAGALILPATWGRRAAVFAAALPVFLLLGSARLLVLALPAALVGSHFTAVHAFYQVLAAAVAVAWLAWLRAKTQSPTAEIEVAGAGRAWKDWATTSMRALAAGVAGGFGAGLLWRSWLWPAAERLRESAHLGHAWSDAQGALTLLPAFQVGLWVALWLTLRSSVSSRGFFRGLAALVATGALLVIGLGELSTHTTWSVPVTAIRVLSLILPIGLALWRPRWLAPRMPTRAKALPARQSV